MLLAGEIGKPHGLAGEVYVVPISDDPRRFQPDSKLIRDTGQPLVVESSRRYRHRLLVKFAGVNTRTDAEELRGPLFVSRHEQRTLQEDEYWPRDLEGCAVVDTAGRALGRVVGIVPRPVQDLLRIETGEGERLVPLVKDIIVSVDTDARRVTVDPPAGLLD
jgi:16S rRNA processing protein RimM